MNEPMERDWVAPLTQEDRDYFAYFRAVCKRYNIVPSKATRLEYYFGIGGVLTFKNARKLVEAAEVIPMERILLETDCPYLAPVPNRGKRNDSSNIRYVIEKLAEIKKMSYDEIVDITNNNARRLFFKEA